jgi:hypothetical protein
MSLARHLTPKWSAMATYELSSSSSSVKEINVQLKLNRAAKKKNKKKKIKKKNWEICIAQTQPYWAALGAEKKD